MNDARTRSYEYETTKSGGGGGRNRSDQHREYRVGNKRERETCLR